MPLYPSTLIRSLSSPAVYCNPKASSSNHRRVRGPEDTGLVVACKTVLLSLG